VRRRGSLLAHIQNTHHQYNLPVPSAKIAYKANRVGVAEAFTDPDARKSMEVDFTLTGHYDDVIRDLQLHLERRVKEQDSQAYYRLRSVPGIGKILALTILYEIHDIGRFPRVQDFLSYARLVKCEHSSAGKRLGSGGAKIGNVHLKWAFSEAAALFLRNNPEGQRHLRRVAGRHGKAKALSILAAKLGRAVYLMLSKDRVFDMKRFLAET
jgi:transposase